MKKSLFISAIFFCAIFLFFIHPFEGSGDFYHHVNTGNYIVKNHEFPNLDTYSFTAKGQPWVAHSWGAGLIFYLLLSNFGEISIALFNALLATIILLLLCILLRSYGPSRLSSLATVALVAVAFSTRFPQRPEIFAYLFVTLILLIDSKRKTIPKLIYLLPVIIFLWANIYGSAVLFGVGLIGIIAMKQLLIDIFTHKKYNLVFYFFCIISFFASFANPFTYRSVFYFFIYIPKVSVYEGEWAGIQTLIHSLPAADLLITQYQILIYLIFVLIYLLLLFSSTKVLKKFIFPIVLSISICLPFFAFRIFPLTAVLCAPIISICGEYALHKKRYPLLILAALLLVSSFAISFWINPPQLKANTNRQLEDMSKFISKHRLAGNAFNLGHLGAYITYKFYPNILVFFDTRDDLYTNTSAISELYQTFTNNESVIPLLKKYNADMVIADYVTDQMNYHDLFYSLDYVPVYMNDRYFIAVSTKLAKEKKLKAIVSVDPFSATASKPGLEKQAEAYYRQLVSQNPDSYLDRLYLSTALSAQRKYDEAIKVANDINVNESNTTEPILIRNKADILAVNYVRKKDCTNTEYYLKIAQKPIDKFMIFQSDLTENYTPRATALYYLICKRDLPTGSAALNSYLSQISNPLRKLELQKEFDNEAKQLGLQ